MISEIMKTKIAVGAGGVSMLNDHMRCSINSFFGRENQENISWKWTNEVWEPS